MWRIVLRLLCILIIIAVFFSAAALTHAQSTFSDSASTQTLQLLNEWRISEGLTPLRVNATLNQMALQQANYVLSRIDSIVDESAYHKDINGRDALRRARELFNWPTYGRPERIEVGENAAEFSVKRAIQFWQESSIHRKAALNRAYREVGIAALQHQGRYLIFTVFGARPGAYPVMVSADRQKIYLSNEYSRYADLSPNRVSVTIFDANMNPLVGPTDWKAVFRAPIGLTQQFYVRLSFDNNGKIVEETTFVDMALDEIILPGGNQSVTAQAATPVPFAMQPTATLPPPTPFVIQLATNTPRPATTQTAPTVAAIQLSATPLPPTAVPPTAIPPTEVPPTATPLPPTPIPAGAVDLLILYDGTTLTVLNASGKAVNLTGLVINRTSIERFQALAAFPADRFGAGSCLQMVAIGRVATVVPECRFVRSELSVDPVRQFWAQAAFQISLNGKVIAVCQPGTGRCEVDLP